MEELKKILIAEYDLVGKRMDAIDTERGECHLDRWHNLRHYRNGIQFCIDEINRLLDEK